jgi:hypothetical protein
VTELFWSYLLRQQVQIIKEFLPVKQPAKYETCSVVGCDAMYSTVYTSGGSPIRAAALTDELPLV